MPGRFCVLVSAVRRREAAVGWSAVGSGQSTLFAATFCAHSFSAGSSNTIARSTFYHELALRAALLALLAQHKKAQTEAPSAKRRDKMSKEDLEAAITSLFIQQHHWHFTQIQVRPPDSLPHAGV